MARKKLPKAALDFFREAGSRGGKAGGSKGGKRSLETMTPEERSARARKAVGAREAKRQQMKPPPSPNSEGLDSLVLPAIEVLAEALGSSKASAARRAARLITRHLADIRSGKQQFAPHVHAAAKARFEELEEKALRVLQED